MLETLASDVSPGKEVQWIEVRSFGWLGLYLTEVHYQHPGTKLTIQVFGSMYLNSIMLPAHVIQSSKIDLLQFGNTC